jgi:two-component sensor histidine kinase
MGESRSRVTLTANALAPGLARRHLHARHTGPSDLNADTLDAVSVVLSEIVTNAVSHGKGPIRVTIDVDETHVLLEVHDRSATIPQRGTVDPRAESGRGLLIVDSIAEEWGVRTAPGGKTVWCVLQLL